MKKSFISYLAPKAEVKKTAELLARLHGAKVTPIEGTEAFNLDVFVAAKERYETIGQVVPCAEDYPAHYFDVFEYEVEE